MIRFATILLCIALFTVAGCKGDKKTNAPQNAPAAATDPANQPPPAKPDELAVAATEAELDELDVKTSEEPETKLDEDEIATPADYEEEAAEKITAANVALELEAVESELSD